MWLFQFSMHFIFSMLIMEAIQMLLHLQSTNYYFDVNTNGFEEALDRQILFFIFLLPVILITALRNVTIECLFVVVFVVQICSVLY